MTLYTVKKWGNCRARQGWEEGQWHFNLRRDLRRKRKEAGMVMVKI
jgi:hypothetical protein